jgi:hypothetical protein
MNLARPVVGRFTPACSSSLNGSAGQASRTGNASDRPWPISPTSEPRSALVQQVGAAVAAGYHHPIEGAGGTHTQREWREIYKWIGVASDINDRKQAEENSKLADFCRMSSLRCLRMSWCSMKRSRRWNVYARAPRRSACATLD